MPQKKKPTKGNKSETKKSKPNKRRFRVNKKLDGKIGTIFIGSEVGSVTFG